MLPICYQDEDLVVVDKPSGLAVHRSQDLKDEVPLLQTLRDQLGRWVYPIHRLDRPTSGLLVFGLSSEAASWVARQFGTGEVCKTYYALVRGWTPEQGSVNRELRADGTGPKQAALTHYERMQKAELPYAVGRYPSARYSLVRVRTETGRFHQIRRHLHSISHPILGDVRHGDGKHNRFAREHLGADRLMLDARMLSFTNLRGEPVEAHKPWDPLWLQVFAKLGWDSL
jgi:tRNA pseudouridine65 synthase